MNKDIRTYLQHPRMRVALTVMALLLDRRRRGDGGGGAAERRRIECDECS